MLLFFYFFFFIIFNLPLFFFFFFFNDPAPTEIYPLPLHAPLPIFVPPLPFREEAVRRARGTLAASRRLVQQGLIARRDAEAGEKALAAAESALAATHAELEQAERMVAEAAAAALLASLPPPRPGAVTVTPTLTRFNGSRE